MKATRPGEDHRIVAVQHALEGQDDGVQGTTWQNPPILDGAFEPLRTAIHRVSDTLSLDLTNNQMRGLARPLDRPGAR